MVNDRTVSNLEREKKTSVLIYFVSFTNFMGIKGFFQKFQAISRVQVAKINFQGFQ